METSANKPTDDVSKVINGRCQNREGNWFPGSGWREPLYRPVGIRYKGGVNVYQALVRNVGTCHRDAKGEGTNGEPARPRVPTRGTGAELLGVGMKLL
jgi:hypothetical protein